MPFNNIEEFVKDGTYKLLYFNNSIEQIWLEVRNSTRYENKLSKIKNSFKKFQATNDKWVKKAYEEVSIIRDGDLNDKLIHAVNEICGNNKLALAFVDFDYSKSPCELKKISKPLFQGWLTMGLRYYSPYDNIFNRL